MQNIPFSILIPVIIVFGFCAAAFFNRLIRRMPFDISLRIKETCSHCKKPVPVLFQIPFLGILFARFRCSCCHSKMRKGSLLVDFSTLLTTFLAFVLWRVFYSNGMPLSLETLFPFLALLWLMISLVPVFVIDFRYHLLPDTISIGGIVFGIMISFIPGDITPLQSILGALIAGGGLYLFAKIIAKILGKQAMGFGDVKLLAGYGALMGAPLAFETLILASFIGICIVFPARLVYAKAFGTESETTAGEFPFGPFLALAAPIVFIYGKWILGLYLAMFEV